MKKILLLIVALMSITPIFAQVDDDVNLNFVKPKKSLIFIGPKVGVTMTSMTQPTECDLYDKSGIGFSGGLAMRARFGKVSENSLEGTGWVGVGLELKYKQNNVKTVDQDLKLGYFEVPVTFQLYPFAKSKVMNPFYIELGASFAGIMSKSPDQLTVNNPGGDYRYVTYHTGDLKGFDVRGVAGIGYTIPNTGLDISGRYYLGTSELAKNFACKMSSIEVSLAWYFTIAKF